MIYSKESPFYATLERRHRLNSALSSKETWHVTVDITDSSMLYQPGDSLGVIPKNRREHVERLLRYTGLPPDYRLVDPRSNKEYTLKEWFSERSDLSTLSEKLFHQALEHAYSRTEASAVLAVVKAYEDSLLIKGHTRENSWYRKIDLASFFEKYLPSGVDYSELFSSHTPIIPRFYSIASSPLVHPNSIDLVVRRVEYDTEHGSRVGLASHYLAIDCPLLKNEVRVFLQSTKHFLLPSEVLIDERPLIMIGPGTGIAPFRAFMQHIVAQCGKKEMANRLWLFFGERHPEYDFLYRDYWEDLQKEKVLSFEAVFSRGSTEQQYVQHRLLERQNQVFRWLHHERGYLYICGDAQKMAKDVESTLLSIAMSEGEMSQEESMKWLVNLRKEGRYRKDVY